MTFKADDFDAALTDFGDEVVFGGIVTSGILDLDGVTLNDPETGALIERVPSVIVKSGVLTGVARGSALTVAGDSYSVRDILRMDDGAHTRLVLS
jgi:hypothetical protein